MTTIANRESTSPLVQAPESIRALFRTRFTRDIAAAREALPDHPYWQAYDGDLRFADLCADALVGYVAKALQSQPALHDQVLERLLANVADWPVGVGINVADPRLRLEPAFVAASNVAILSEIAIGRKTGWPGDAAPNDVLRWMSERGDDNLRSFARALLERDDWLPVAIKDQGNGNRTVTIDANGYRVMGFAHVYMAWRDVVHDARSALGAARVAWLAVRDSSDETLAIIARGALEQANHPPTDEEAVRELTASLRAVLPLALDASGFASDPPLTEEDALATEDGVLCWDEGFARYLEHLGDQGKAIARVVRDKARDRVVAHAGSADRSRSGGAVWALWADLDARPACLRFGRTLAYALWLEKVRARVVRGNVRAPSTVMHAIHHGRIEGGNLLAATPDIQTISVRVLPPSGVALLLPFADGIRALDNGKSVSLRQVFTGTMERDYLATWAAWIDSGADVTGLFQWDEKEVLGSYFKRKLVADHGTSTRFHSKVVKSLRSNLDRFTNMKVTGVEDVEAKQPEAFVQAYRARSGKSPPMYRHAPILLGALRHHFTQYPRAILQLDPDDAPAAIGIAGLVRERASAMLQGDRSHEAPLTAWLEVASEDYRAAFRKHGPPYWRRASEKLARIVEEAAIGRLTFAGAGPDAVGVMRCNDVLLDAYKPLLERHVLHKKAEQKALIEEKVRARRRRST